MTIDYVNALNGPRKMELVRGLLGFIGPRLGHKDIMVSIKLNGSKIYGYSSGRRLEVGGRALSTLDPVTLMFRAGRMLLKANSRKGTRWKTCARQAFELLECWVMREIESDHPDLPPFGLKELRTRTGAQILGDWLEEQGSDWQFIVRLMGDFQARNPEWF